MNDKIQVDVQAMNDQVVVINLNGDVTKAAESSIQAAYRQVSERQIDYIIFNFQQNQYIDSLGLTIMIKIVAEAQQQRQHLRMTLPSRHSQKIFRLLGIDRYAPIYSNLNEALHGFETQSTLLAA